MLKASFKSFINSHLQDHEYAVILGPAMIGESLVIVVGRHSFIEEVQSFHNITFRELADNVNALSERYDHAPVFINGIGVGAAIAERIPTAKVFWQSK